MSRKWRVHYEGWMDFDEDDGVHSEQQARAKALSYVDISDDGGVTVTAVYELHPIPMEVTP